MSVRAFGAAGALLIVLAGCGSASSAAGSPSAGAGPAFSLGPPLKVAGPAKTGVSPAIALEGSYQVQWSVTPDRAGCTFHLIVATAADGPAVADLGRATVPGKAAYPGSASFAVPSGRYFIRQDRSVSSSCRGGWTATLNSQIEGSP